MTLLERAAHRVVPTCGNCVNRVDGRCVVIANGSSARAQINRRLGFTSGDPDVTPETSCAGKMYACGIEVDKLPFMPFPTLIARETIRLVLHI